MAEALAINSDLVESPDDLELPAKGLKCQKCRSGFLAQVQDSNVNFQSTRDLYLLEEDNLPGWVHQKIEEAGWTKGRLNCPKCQTRVGNFDFVSGTETQVHLIKSKVDFWARPCSSSQVEEIIPVDSISSTSSSYSSSTTSSGMGTPASSHDRSSSMYSQSSQSEMQIFGLITSETDDTCSSASTPSPTSLSSSSSTTSSAIATEDSADNMTEAEIQRSKQKHRLRLRQRKINRAKERKWLEKKDQRKRGRLLKFFEIMDGEPELDNLDSSLICPVCLDLLFEPHIVVPCKHIFCETCLRRIGKKDPMDTTCPMCRQQIAYCEPQSELSLSIRESYPEVYQKRLKAEKRSDVYEMPLPWRPGWRNLITGRPFGGNLADGGSIFDYLKALVQLLPYYLPPVVIANIVNMMFFAILLASVEIVQFLNSFKSMQYLKKCLASAIGGYITLAPSPRKRAIYSNVAMGSTPYSFHDVVLLQSPAVASMAATTSLQDSDAIPMLPPTYIAPESTLVMDATFAYVTMGVVLVTMAFGNMIIINYPDGVARRDRSINRWFGPFFGVLCIKMMDFFGVFIFFILPIMAIPLIQIVSQEAEAAQSESESSETSMHNHSLFQVIGRAFISFCVLLWKAMTWRNFSCFSVAIWAFFYAYFRRGGGRRRPPIDIWWEAGG